MKPKTLLKCVFPFLIYQGRMYLLFKSCNSKIKTTKLTLKGKYGKCQYSSFLWTVFPPWSSVLYIFCCSFFSCRYTIVSFVYYITSTSQKMKIVLAPLCLSNASRAWWDMAVACILCMQHLSLQAFFMGEWFLRYLHHLQYARHVANGHSLRRCSLI